MGDANCDSKMKPCPFCGGLARVAESFEGGLFWARCDGCSARNFGTSEKEAAEKWNARTPLKWWIRLADSKPAESPVDLLYVFGRVEDGGLEFGSAFFDAGEFAFHGKKMEVLHWMPASAMERPK